MPYNIVSKMLPKILKWHPYKLQLLFELNDANLSISYNFSSQMLTQMEIERNS